MSSNRRSTHFWSEEETDFLLQTLKEMNIDRYRDGRKHRNSLIFRKVCARHKEAGFARSCDQVKHRWKTLKSIYYKAKKQNTSSSNAAFKHFDTMEEIFGHRPLVVMANQTEVEIDLKDESPLSDSKCFTFEDGECDDGECHCHQHVSFKVKKKKKKGSIFFSFLQRWYQTFITFIM